MKKVFTITILIFTTILAHSQSFESNNNSVSSWRGKYEASIGIGVFPNYGANVYVGATNGYSTIGLYSGIQGLVVSSPGIALIPIIPLYRHYFLDKSLKMRPYVDGGIGANLFLSKAM